MSFSNFTSKTGVNSTYDLTLEALLDDLGFVQFDYIVYQFVMPVAGVFGSILSVLSIWVFFQHEFKAQIYDYYRVLVITYFIHLSLSVPYGLFFTPIYFPNIDTYVWATYQSFYITFSNFLCHFTGVIEIGIMLDRIRLFIPRVGKYYSFSPRKCCFIFFVLSCVINLHETFVYTPGIGGVFTYLDSNGTSRQGTFYYVVLTDLAESKAGVIITIIIYIVRDLFTLIVGVVLNVVSLIEIKRYLKNRRIIFSQTTHISSKVFPSFPLERDLSSKDHSNDTSQKLLLMVISLSLISIVTRSILLACNICYLYILNYVTLILGTVADLALVLGPALSFFVFFSFNKHFQRIVLKLCHM